MSTNEARTEGVNALRGILVGVPLGVASWAALIAAVWEVIA